MPVLKITGSATVREQLTLKSEPPISLSSVYQDCRWYTSTEPNGEYIPVKGTHTRSLILQPDQVGCYVKAVWNGETTPVVGPVQPLPQARHSDWMVNGKYGISHHFLSDYLNRTARRRAEKIAAHESWSDVVDGFDCDHYVQQVVASGAAFVIFTLGQNSGYYLSPNATYEKLAGVQPGERCARRDLPLELAEKLAAHNIKLMLYLPGNPPFRAHIQGKDFAITKRFGYTPAKDTYPSQHAQQLWHQVIEEWCLRYQDKIAGWWFDGMFRNHTGIGQGHDQARDDDQSYGWSSLANLVKSWNPKAVVAMNQGEGDRGFAPFDDYTGGETNRTGPLPVNGRWCDADQTVQWMAWTYLGRHNLFWAGWGNRGRSKRTSKLVSWVKAATDKGGVICLDVRINRWGDFEPAQLQQLQALKAVVRPGPDA